jgi:spore coat protein U-like protein
VGIGSGLSANKASTFGSRAMSNGGAIYMGYDSYPTAALTQEWNMINVESIQSTGNPVSSSPMGAFLQGKMHLRTPTPTL